MKMHIVLDITTGQTKARGKSGRWYTQDQIERATDARKNPGADPEGDAFRDDLDRSDWSDQDMQAALLAEMHDCPECRAAFAAGETPRFVDPPKPKRWAKPRWRDLKRRTR